MRKTASRKLSRRRFLELTAVGGALAALAACDALEPPVSSPPAPTRVPSPLPLPQPADVTARIFLQAWAQNDFEGMYSVLAPASQAKISVDDFVRTYQNFHREATVTETHATLTAIAEEGNTATAQFKVVFDTAVVGRIERDNAFSLLRENNRWGVLWALRLILPELENGNRVKLSVTKSTRGNIYDRIGQPIAIGVSALVVNLWPAEMRRHGIEAQVLAALEPILGMTQQEIQRRYVGQNPEWKIPIQTITPEVAQRNAEVLSLPGIIIEEQEARAYPLGAAAGHIAGYVGQISAQELHELYPLGYREGDMFGRAGLEKLGEKYLSGGRGGKLVVLTPEGANAGVIAERPAEQSQSIYATIDANLQRYVATLLTNVRGSITVMDVRNGNILALYSSPSYDPNAFVDRNRNAERQTYLTGPQKAMLNRSTQGVYPHGSVQKIITLAAALERGGLSPHTPFHCTGIWRGIGYPKACWINAYGRTHGTVSLQHALTVSCDIAFYQTGLILHSKDANLLTSFCYAFGLGSETGIGLEENAGNVPDPRTQQPWIPTDTVDMAIGQDTFLVSPLQVLDFVAAVANGGTLWRPNLILKIEDLVNGTQEVVKPQKRGTLPVSEANLQIIREAMKTVTTAKDGTASFVFNKLPITVAGKTGTAQVPGKNEPHAWFAGYAPADDPQIACVVMVENGGEGSKVAAPLFRKVIEKYFGIKPTPTPGAPGAPLLPTETPPPSE